MMTLNKGRKVASAERVTCVLGQDQQEEAEVGVGDGCRTEARGLLMRNGTAAVAIPVVRCMVLGFCCLLLLLVALEGNSYHVETEVEVCSWKISWIGKSAPDFVKRMLEK